MEMSIPILLISILLFFVLFFGIGFLLNMLLRMSWIMAVLYPIVFILIVDDIKFIEYIQNPAASFSRLGDKISSLAAADMTILTSGFIGAVASGIVIRLLRAKGYRMF
jgi:purine-cytosine permease-like protein